MGRAYNPEDKILVLGVNRILCHRVGLGDDDLNVANVRLGLNGDYLVRECNAASLDLATGTVLYEAS